MKCRSKPKRLHMHQNVGTRGDQEAGSRHTFAGYYAKDKRTVKAMIKFILTFGKPDSTVKIQE